MQVTKELLDNDIKGMENSLENLKAQMAQTVGALTTLKNIRDYVVKPEPKGSKVDPSKFSGPASQRKPKEQK